MNVMRRTARTLSVFSTVVAAVADVLAEASVDRHPMHDAMVEAMLAEAEDLEAEDFKVGMYM